MTEATERRNNRLPMLLALIGIIAYRLITAYRSAEKVPTVHEGLDSLTPVYDELVSTEVQVTSGMDPDDPTWAPPDGWSVVYDFNSSDEINQLFTSPTGYEYVEDSLLKWNITPGNTRTAVREFLTKAWSRMAMCINMELVQSSSVDTYLFDFTSHLATGGFTRVIIRAIGIVPPLKVEDASQSPILGYDFTPPSGWFVMVMDNTPNQTPYFRIYDRDKNLAFGIELRRSPSPGPWECVIINVWNTSYFITNYRIDWIAFKY